MKKALFIVDIQQKYDKNFTKEYLEKVEEYIGTSSSNYEKIVMVMENNEDNGDFIPKEIHMELSIRPVFKCYDSDYSLEKLNRSTLFQKKGKSLVPRFNIPDGDFCFMDREGYFVGKKEDGKLFIDFMSKDLYMLLNLFRDFDEVEIIGGGINHCVKKTQEYFRFIGINNTRINKDMCYAISYQKAPCPDFLFDSYIENHQRD